MFPSITELHDVLFDEQTCIQFLFNNGIIDIPSRCSACNSFMKQEGKLFRCRSKSCRKSVSIFHSSFFSNSRLKCNEAMFLLYLFHAKVSSTSIHMMTGHSVHTIAEYKRYYMQLLASDLDDEDAVIGGQDVIVEIDESKLGKRKYNRGHRVNGVWILVGVEKTPERRMFIESIADRSAATILEVISRHVRVGSRIRTDCWKGYLNLPTLGMSHETVNHSMHFRDPATGVNTNTVEGNNNGIKMAIAPRNRTTESIDDFLPVLVWRRLHEPHIWRDFLLALKRTAYID